MAYKVSARAIGSRGPSRFWSIGPTISWPVFDAGKIRANIEIRNAQQEQALRLYEKSVLTGLGTLKALWSITAMSKAAIVPCSKRWRPIAARSNLANDLYTQGLVPFLNVLDAQRTLYASESDLAVSEASLASNLVALYKALGGGWETN